MPAFLFSTAGRWLIGVAAVSAVLWAVYLRGRDAARQEAVRTALEAMEARDATDRRVDRLPDGGAADELLRRWSRQPE